MGSELTLTSNRYIINVIKSLENRVIILKRTTKKRIPWYCNWSINESSFTINEKCTHTIS